MTGAIEEQMKVGPKGQVVIPRVMRKTLKVHPGSKVIFRLEDGRLTLEKAQTDTVGVLEAIAAKGSSVTRFSPHSYEEELSGRE